MYNIKLISEIIDLSKGNKFFLDVNKIEIYNGYYVISINIHKDLVIVYNYWKFGVVGSFLFSSNYKKMNFLTKNILSKLRNNGYNVEMILKNNY